MPASRARLLLPLLLAAAVGMPQASRAQGGPPLVTDDPDTPPDGHWEINLATIGVRSTGEEQLSLPDADINYGWSDHIQLKIDTPWLLSRADGEPAKSGLGATDLDSTVNWAATCRRVRWGGCSSRTPGLSLLFAAGREFGPARPDHEQLLFYFGLQVLR